MLPILRIIPVGGVLVAVVILVLAMSPPREMRQGVAPEMVLARGPLIDRRDHPEWPQFLVRAAFRRADEIVKLSDLPNQPMRVALAALPPERPVIAPAPPEAAVVPDGPAADAPSTGSNVMAPPPAAKADLPAPPVVTSSNVDDAKASATIAAASPTETPPQVKSANVTPQAQMAEVASVATAAEVEPKQVQVPADGSSEPATAPLPPQPPAPLTKVAGLPLERPAIDPDAADVTGTISAANDATIPVDIGETSSTELPIVLPRERPPIVQTIQRGRSSLHPGRRLERRTLRRGKAKGTSKPSASSNDQAASRVNLFEALFANADTPPPQAAKRGKTSSGQSANPAYPHIIYYPITSP